MDLDTWRAYNNLSFREAARLFGIASAGHLSNVEKGRVWLSPEALIRISQVTSIIGPAEVTARDILWCWIDDHEELYSRIKRAAEKVANRHKETMNGKRQTKEESAANRKARTKSKAARAKGKRRNARRPRA